MKQSGLFYFEQQFIMQAQMFWKRCKDPHGFGYQETLADHHSNQHVHRLSVHVALVWSLYTLLMVLHATGMGAGNHVGASSCVRTLTL